MAHLKPTPFPLPKSPAANSKFTLTLSRGPQRFAVGQSVSLAEIGRSLTAPASKYGALAPATVAQSGRHEEKDKGATAAAAAAAAAGIDVDAVHLHDADADKETHVPLTPRMGQYLFTGEVTFGASKIVGQFDTGSPDFVVEKGFYKPVPGKTIDTHKESQLSYADGTKATARVYLDSFAIGGLPPVRGVAGGLSDKDFLGEQEHSNAIIGMSLPDLSVNTGGYASLDPRAKPFLQRLVEEKVLQENLFSFYIDEAHSELTLGGISEQALPPSRASGDAEAGALTPEWLDVTPTSGGFWTVRGNVNGEAWDLLCDTGSAFMTYGSLSAFRRLFSACSDTVDLFTDSGGWTFALLKDKRERRDTPQDALPRITFELGGLTVQANRETVQFARVKDKENRWLVGVACMPDILGKDKAESTILCGDTFLRNFVTVHDVEKRRVGFCPTSQTLVVEAGK